MQLIMSNENHKERNFKNTKTIFQIIKIGASTIAILVGIFAVTEYQKYKQTSVHQEVSNGSQIGDRNVKNNVHGDNLGTINNVDSGKIDNSNRSVNIGGSNNTVGNVVTGDNNSINTKK
jgi:hypothetical protein